MRWLFEVASLLVGSAGAALPAPAAAQASRPNTRAIDPAWLRADAATTTAEFDLIAGLTGLNGALNFNGYRDGELTLTVPLGWTVVMHFTNRDGDLPHSAEVISEVTPVPIASVPAAFDRAFTIRLEQGIQHGDTDDIRFVANKEGSFLVFCAVPGHGAAGMWIRLTVSGSARTASLSASPSGGS